MLQQDLKDKLPFPVAVIFGILYSAFYIFNRVLIYPIIYGYDVNDELRYLLNIPLLIWLTSLLALVVLLFIKKPNLGFTLVLGTLMLVEFYWFCTDFSYLVNSFDEFYIYYLLEYLFTISALSLLCVQSISTYTNFGKNSLNKIWFLPGVLLFSMDFYYVCSRIVPHIVEYFSVRDILTVLIDVIAIRIPFAVFMLLLGKWFASVASIRQQHIVSDKNQTDKAAVYNVPINTYEAPRQQVQPIYQNTTPNYVRPVQQQVVPQNVMHQATSNTEQELQKYKEIYEKGLITEEEYNAKKKQILGL